MLHLLLLLTLKILTYILLYDGFITNPTIHASYFLTNNPVFANGHSHLDLEAQSTAPLPTFCLFLCFYSIARLKKAASRFKSHSPQKEFNKMS